MGGTKVDYISLKDQIREKAYEIGIDKVGFTHAEPFYDLEDSIREQHKNGHQAGFEHKEVEERIYPELMFDRAQSISAIALAYASAVNDETNRVRGERRG